jgi:hypothetical protein
MDTYERLTVEADTLARCGHHSEAAEKYGQAAAVAGRQAQFWAGVLWAWAGVVVGMAFMLAINEWTR